MEELSTQIKGKITELQIASCFLEKGIIVSQPLINTRYDFLIDYKNKIYKIQVKTCRLSNEGDSLIFNTSNSHTNTKETLNRSYENEIDYFATFYKNKCYLIPISECGKRNKTLRIFPPKNGQKIGVSFLEDYELEKILSNL